MNNKLQNLEKKFGLAENLINELSSTIEDITSTDLVSCINETETTSVSNDESILNLQTLKQDFLLIRNNLIRLINTGQRILEEASVLTIADLRPSHLDALTNLQNTLGNNLKMLLDIYKTLSEIEKVRQKPIKTSSIDQNSGTINNSTQVFVGNSSDLLKLINENNQN